MNQDLLEVHQGSILQYLQSHVHYKIDIIHNIIDAIYQMVLEFAQCTNAFNIIVIVASDGYDNSEHRIDELRQLIVSQRNVRVIVGQYTEENGQQPNNLLIQLRDQLPGYVKIINNLTYEHIKDYCCLYENNKVNIMFGMSNLISMQKHIQIVSCLFVQLAMRYNVKKLYIINNQDITEVALPSQIYLNEQKQEKKDKSCNFKMLFFLSCFIGYTVFCPL